MLHTPTVTQRIALSENPDNSHNRTGIALNIILIMIPVITSNLKMKSVIRIVLAVRRLMVSVRLRRKL